MDPKKLESRLCEWSRQLGFTLTDGTFPQSTFFSQLISTPNTVHLWEEIINKVEPRDKVQKVRKQILVAKLKSDEKQESQQDPMLKFHNSDIQRKIELWKKKKALEKMIAEKKNEMNQLKSDIFKKAQAIQLESCKLADIEKHYSDLKDKLLISNLLLNKYRDDIENYEQLIAKIKSYRLENSLETLNIAENHGVLENNKDKLKKLIMKNSEKHVSEIRQGNLDEISEFITDKNSVKKLWNLLLDFKINNLKDFSSTVDEINSKENDLKNENKDSISLISLQEKFMLDITENSLSSIFNRRMEKLENQKLKEITLNIEKLMFNKSIASLSQIEISYLQPNETGDSLTGRKEKMEKFMKALTVYGLKKRHEILKREVEKLIKENKKNEHWSSEKEKFENEVMNISKALESIKEEAIELMNMQKLSIQDITNNHKELVFLTNSIYNDLNERKVIERMTRFVTDIKNGSEKEMELVAEMCLDAFRKIQISPGKDIYWFESLRDCLDQYGGELREFFSKLLISPYEKPEMIVKKVEDRKLFSSFVNDLITKFEEDVKNCQIHLTKESDISINPKVIEKNYKETLRILSTVSARQEKLKTELNLIRNIIKNWLKQPYRLMIPENITVNSLTLTHFEEKYKTVQSEINYTTELNQKSNKF